MAFAVVACSHCKSPWSIELRHERVTCPRCQKSVDVKRRTRLWQGDNARDAQAAVANLRAQFSGGQAQVQALRDDRPVPRFASPIGAAAAKANAVTNKSQKAETVALWLTRLVGDASHDQYVEALRQAGLDAERTEKEIMRMLAMDITFEPRAGHYRCLES